MHDCHRQIRCVNGQLICRADEMTSADKMLFRLIRGPSYLMGQIRWPSYLTEADKVTYDIQAKAGQPCHFLLLGHCQIRQFEWRVVVYVKPKTCRRVAFHFWHTSKLCTKTNRERPLPHTTDWFCCLVSNLAQQDQVMHRLPCQFHDLSRSISVTSRLQL